MYINAAGIPLIFLNDFKTYTDLLHNRGDIYSDKPRMVMTGELCGAEYMVCPPSIETKTGRQRSSLSQVPFTGAGERMRRQRRILVKALGAGSIKTYEPILDGQSRDFIQNLTKPAMDFRQTLLQFVWFPSFPGAEGFIASQVQRRSDAEGVVWPQADFRRR